MADYVYGIVERATPPPDVSGVGGAAVRTVDADTMRALVSSVPDREVRLGREELRAHAAVLDAALGQGTVLPMRAGIVLADDEEVRARVLDDDAEMLRDQIERLAGTCEVGIRAIYDETRLMAEVVAGSPQIADLRELVRARPEAAAYAERIRLGEMVAAAVQRIREVDAEQLLAILGQLAADVRVAPPAHEHVALACACLVHRARLPEFDDVLEAFAEGQGGRLRIRYAGPRPPYSFVNPAEAS
jgi:hypothetical protein